MFFNFSANRHENCLEQVFRSLDAKDSKGLMFSSSSEQIEAPRSFTFFSQFLKELIATLKYCNDSSHSQGTCIILPDCSSSSVKHLVSLLSYGCTQTNTTVEDVGAVREVAEMLGIDLKNLSYEGVKNDCSKVEVDERELHGNDMYSEDFNSKEEMGNMQSQIRIAPFAKADLGIRNVVQNLESEKCSPCKSKFVCDTLNKERLEKEKVIKPALTKLNFVNAVKKETDNISMVDLTIKKQEEEQLSKTITPLLSKENKTNLVTAYSVRFTTPSTKPRPFVKNYQVLHNCEECQRSFRSEHGLAVHKKTNLEHGLRAVTQSKIVQCKVCLQELQSRPEFFNHYEIHNETRRRVLGLKNKMNKKQTFECSLCDFSFDCYSRKSRHRNITKEHMRRVHGI